TAGVTHDRPQCMIGETQLSVAVPTEASRLRLRSRAISRWAVTDDRAEGWFPEDRLHKWDFHGRPFFHGNDVVLDVPAAALTVALGPQHIVPVSTQEGCQQDIVPPSAEA